MVDNIPGLSPFLLSDLPALFHYQDQTNLRRFVQVVSKVSQAQYLLFNSVFELESTVIDALQSEFPFPLYSLGPLIPYFNLHDHNSSHPTTPNGPTPDYLKWLDCQPQSSVLYVSLGSFLSVSSSQMDEIVAGLLISGMKYLLVARDKALGLKESLCGGGSGMAIPWCDQLKASPPSLPKSTAVIPTDVSPSHTVPTFSRPIKQQRNGAHFKAFDNAMADFKSRQDTKKNSNQFHSEPLHDPIKMPV
ncbi:hypothetical protein Vadar_011493 [Vaccinium darrowii]|uniref:Uncharacterized protein n=1 Tax=Vaccinium darrowii TaxID=229202 RepID=A0ACB7X074_9ERIC|nr:hypothetical protein Vadar_011493 [Vaccinium darrowii]